MITVTLMFVLTGAFSFVSYMFYQNIGWTEGYAAWLPMIVPGLFAGAGTVFFLRPYLEGINKEIIEAAQIDGMGFWQIFFAIIIPLSKPALIAQFIFGFVAGYNNYMGPLLYLEGVPELATLQLVLADVRGTFPGLGKENIHCASAVLGMLPLILIYCFLQKFFIKGIVVGGVKG